MSSESRPLSAEMPVLSRRVTTLHTAARDLTRRICEDPLLRGKLLGTGREQPPSLKLYVKPSRPGRLPAAVVLPGLADVADACRDVEPLTPYAPLLRRAVLKSAKNTFDSVLSRMQLRRFLRQFAADTAFCHRCGSGPYSLVVSSAGVDCSSGKQEDLAAACAVCSTILIASDPQGRDTRALMDFEAQVVRRRVACLEDKLNVLAVIDRALKAHSNMGAAIGSSSAQLLLVPSRPAASELMAASGGALADAAAATRRSRSDRGRFIPTRSAPRTASVPMRPLLVPNRTNLVLLPAIDATRLSAAHEGMAGRADAAQQIRR